MEEDRHHIKGSLVAAFVTMRNIFLLSDGLVTDQAGREFDDVSKVHELSRYVGLLSAGQYSTYNASNIAIVPREVANHCKARGLEYINEVTSMVKNRLEMDWNSYVNHNGNQINPKGMLAYVAGFDKNNSPQLYYLCDKTTPIFNIQTIPLLQDLVWSAHAAESGVDYSVNDVISKHLNISQIASALRMGSDIKPLIIGAFDKTKDELSIKYPNQIGGKTFMAEISLANGFIFLDKKADGDTFFC